MRRANDAGKCGRRKHALLVGRQVQVTLRHRQHKANAACFHVNRIQCDARNQDEHIIEGAEFWTNIQFSK